MKTIEVPNVTKASWYEGAYTLAFIYSTKGNFLLKGYRGDVEAWIKSQNIKYFGKFIMYYHGQKRHMWNTNTSVYISEPTIKKTQSSISAKYHFVIWRSSEETIKLKRLPKRYIPELFD